MPINASSQLSGINYSVKDGLPSRETYFLHQDYDGYLWVCTDKGVARYDGYRFESFSTKDGLTFNTVFNAFEDDDHNIWFNCYDGSITIYDYDEKKFKPFRGNSQIKRYLGKRKLEHYWPHCIGFKGDRALIYLYAGGTSRVAPEMFEIDRRTSKVTNRKVVKVGIAEYDNLYTSIKLLKNGNLSLDMFLKRNNTNQKGPLMDLMNHELLPKKLKNVRSISFSEKEILLCTKEGIQIITEQGIVEYSTKVASNMLRDRDGNFWISTLNNGIYKMTDRKFHLYSLSSFLEKGDKFLSINKFGDKLLLGSEFGSIVCFRPRDEKKEIIPLRGKRYSINELEDVNSHIVTNRGLQIVNNNKINIKQIRSIEQGRTKLVREHKAGLISIDLKYNILFSSSFWQEKADVTIANDSYIFSLHSALSGSVYFSTANNVKRINSDYSITDCTRQFKVLNATVRTIASTKDSLLILAASGRGVNLIHGDSVIEINEKNGLLSDFVNDIISFERGSFWCATNKGISKISYRKTEQGVTDIKIKNFYRDNGLGASYINKLFYWRQSVWALRDETLIRFDADLKLNTPPPPKLHILGIINNGKRYKSNTTFNYNKNDLKIEYIGISTRKPVAGYFYKYKLERDGKKENWIGTNLRSIDLTKLPSGDYTFFVTARSENSIWVQPVSIPFVIKPHWAATWWAKSLGVLLLIMALIIFYKRSINQRKAKYEETLSLEKLKSRLNSMELEVLRGQMNPHFIYNSLSLVQNYILEENKLVAHELISQMAKLLREGLEYSQYENISLNQEVDFLRNYMDIELKRFSDRFTYDIEVDENIGSDISIPPLMIQPICENAIKHSYGEDQVNIRIKFSSNTEDSIKVLISDNGVGYKNVKKKFTDSEKKSLGLTLLSKRIDIFKEQNLRAAYSISSLNKITNTGTKVEIILPIN